MDILVASRLAAHPDPVLRLAASLASGLAAELTLLTVARDAGAAAAAEDALADARAQLRSLPGAPSCRTRLRLGSPAAEILAELEASDPALVVLGERAQPKPLSRRVPGSTTRRVISSLSVTKIVLRSPRIDSPTTATTASIGLVAMGPLCAPEVSDSRTSQRNSRPPSAHS